MKNVTITMDEATLHQARIAAAHEGKSLSKFIAETVKRRVGPSLTKKEAMDRFLAGPLMDLTDENGQAPSRDHLNGR
ncbi:MAG TPA: hypothetical protein VGU24_00350 [Microvirga sp.]|jgi:hypothetical protein|nr:hypothetical protein [Microvirga sp.]